MQPEIVKFLGYDPSPLDVKTLSEKVLKYQKSHGMSQKELAKRLGIDPTTLSRIERKSGRCFRAILENVTEFLSSQDLDCKR